MRRFVLSLVWCYFVLVFVSPLSIAITSLGEKRANLGAFCTFVRFALVCLFPLSFGVWEGLRLVIVHFLDFSFTFFFRVTIDRFALFHLTVCDYLCFTDEVESYPHAEHTYVCTL